MHPRLLKINDQGVSRPHHLCLYHHNMPTHKKKLMQ
jgi:hypothetical protein